MFATKSGPQLFSGTNRTGWFQDTAQPPRRVNVDAVARQVQADIDALPYEGTPFSILSVKTAQNPIPELQRSITAGTIVPAFSTALVPEYSVNKLQYGSIASVFSPIPLSIFGIGTEIGVLVITMGKAYLAEIAMDFASGGMERVSKKLAKGFSSRIKTGRGEGRGRHVNIRGADGATPGDQDDVYDDPCKWYEFWCYMF